LIDALHRVKDSFNSYPLDRFAQAGAVAAMQDQAYFDETRQHVIKTREKLVADLEKMGFEVLPSGANFIFARHPKHDGAELTAKLRAENIVIRHFKKPAKVDQFLRITVGTDTECQALVSALRKMV
jgi:histidinol-phosphate aminotransferase